MQLECLKRYVEDMKGSMNLFNTVNADLKTKFMGRQVHVIDRMGGRTSGVFRGFRILLDPEKEKPVPEMCVCIQLLKKDGSPSNRLRIVKCEDAYIRLMGMKRPR